MKKLIVLISALLLSSVTSFAQIFMIDSFSLSSSDGGYGIYVNINTDEWTELYFDLDTDDPSQKTRMQLSGKEVNDLKENLKSAMDLFKVWKSTAESNSMKLLTKKMPLEMDTQEIFFTQDGNWHMAESVQLYVTFFVDDKGQCYSILETGTLVNKEVVSKGFTWASGFSPNGRWNTAWSRSEKTMIHYGNNAFLIFANPSEVDQFISQLEAAISWKNHNKDMGQLLLSPKKNKKR